MLLAGSCPRRATLGRGVGQQSILPGREGAELQGAHILLGGACGAPLCQESSLCWPCRVRQGCPHVRGCAGPGIGSGRGHAGPTGALSSVQVPAGVSSGPGGLEHSPLPRRPRQGTRPRAGQQPWATRSSGPSWWPPGHLLSAPAPCGNQSSCLRPQRVGPRPLAPHSHRAVPLRARACLGSSQTPGDRPPGTRRVGGVGACGAVQSPPVLWG